MLESQKGGIFHQGENILNLGRDWSSRSDMSHRMYLIDDSIRKNVAFGISDEQIDDEKVLNALERANYLILVKIKKRYP